MRTRERSTYPSVMSWLTGSSDPLSCTNAQNGCVNAVSLQSWITTGATCFPRSRRNPLESLYFRLRNYPRHDCRMYTRILAQNFLPDPLPRLHQMSALFQVLVRTTQTRPQFCSSPVGVRVLY